MAECTEAERAFLDAFRDGRNVFEAKRYLIFERVMREAPELLGDLYRNACQRRALDASSGRKWEELRKFFDGDTRIFDALYEFTEGTW